MAGLLWRAIGRQESPVRLRSPQDTIRCFSSPGLSRCRRKFRSIITSAVLHERNPVVAGRLTDLPMPVFSEIVLEGFLYPNELKSEGKFGEWPGYYVSDARPEPVIQVKAVYYRNDPIILGAWPGRPPHDSTYRHSIIKSANLGNCSSAPESAESPASTGRSRARQIF